MHVLFDRCHDTRAKRVTFKSAFISGAGYPGGVRRLVSLGLHPTIRFCFDTQKICVLELFSKRRTTMAIRVSTGWYNRAQHRTTRTPCPTFPTSSTPTTPLRATGGSSHTSRRFRSGIGRVARSWRRVQTFSRRRVCRTPKKHWRSTRRPYTRLSPDWASTKLLKTMRARTITTRFVAVTHNTGFASWVTTRQRLRRGRSSH